MIMVMNLVPCFNLKIHIFFFQTFLPFQLLNLDVTEGDSRFGRWWFWLSLRASGRARERCSWRIRERNTARNVRCWDAMEIACKMSLIWCFNECSNRFIFFASGVHEAYWAMRQQRSTLNEFKSDDRASAQVIYPAIARFFCFVSFLKHFRKSYVEHTHRPGHGLIATVGAQILRSPGLVGNMSENIWNPMCKIVIVQTISIYIYSKFFCRKSSFNSRTSDSAIEIPTSNPWRSCLPGTDKKSVGWSEGLSEHISSITCVYIWYIFIWYILYQSDVCS